MNVTVTVPNLRCSLSWDLYLTGSTLGHFCPALRCWPTKASMRNLWQFVDVDLAQSRGLWNERDPCAFRPPSCLCAYSAPPGCWKLSKKEVPKRKVAYKASTQGKSRVTGIYNVWCFSRVQVAFCAVRCLPGKAKHFTLRVLGLQPMNPFGRMNIPV